MNRGRIRLKIIALAVASVTGLGLFTDFLSNRADAGGTVESRPMTLNEAEQLIKLSNEEVGASVGGLSSKKADITISKTESLKMQGLSLKDMKNSGEDTSGTTTLKGVSRLSLSPNLVLKGANSPIEFVNDGKIIEPDNIKTSSTLGYLWVGKDWDGDGREDDYIPSQEEMWSISFGKDMQQYASGLPCSPDWNDCAELYVANGEIRVKRTGVRGKPDKQNLLKGTIQLNLSSSGYSTVHVEGVNKYIPRYCSNWNGVKVPNMAYPDDGRNGQQCIVSIMDSWYYNIFPKSYAQGSSVSVMRNECNYTQEEKRQSLFQILKRQPTATEMANLSLVVKYQENVPAGDGEIGTVQPVVVGIITSNGNYQTKYTKVEGANADAGGFIEGADVGNFSIEEDSVELYDAETGKKVTTLSSRLAGRQLELRYKANYTAPKPQVMAEEYKNLKGVLTTLVINNAIAPGQILVSDPLNSKDAHLELIKIDPTKNLVGYQGKIRFILGSPQEVYGLHNLGVMINPPASVYNTATPKEHSAVTESNGDDNVGYTVDLATPRPDFVISKVKFTTPKTSIIHNYPEQDDYSIVLPAGETEVVAKVWGQNIDEDSAGNYNVNISGTLKTDKIDINEQAVLQRSISIGNVDYGIDGLFLGKPRPTSVDDHPDDYSKLGLDDEGNPKESSTILYNNTPVEQSKIMPGFGPLKYTTLPARSGVIKSGYFLRVDNGKFEYRADYDVRKDTTDVFHQPTSVSQVTEAHDQTNRITNFQSNIAESLFSSSLISTFKQSGIGLLRDGNGNVIGDATQAQQFNLNVASDEDDNYNQEDYKIMNVPVVTTLKESTASATGKLSQVAMDDKTADNIFVKGKADREIAEVSVDPDTYENITMTPVTIKFKLPCEVYDRKIYIDFKIKQLAGGDGQKETNLSNNTGSFIMDSSSQRQPTGLSATKPKVLENSVYWTNTKDESEYQANKEYDYNTVTLSQNAGSEVIDPSNSQAKSGVQLNKTYKVYWFCPPDISKIKADTNSSKWRKGSRGPYRGKMVNEDCVVFNQRDYDYNVGSYPDYMFSKKLEEDDNGSAKQTAITTVEEAIEFIEEENERRREKNAEDRRWWKNKSKKYRKKHNPPTPRPMLPTDASAFKGDGFYSSYFPSDINSQINRGSNAIYNGGLFSYFQAQYTEYYHSIYKLTFDYGTQRFGLGINELSKDYSYENNLYKITTDSKGETTSSGNARNSGPVYTINQYLDRNNTDRDYFLSSKFYIDMYETNGKYAFMPSLIQPIPVMMTDTNGNKIVDTKPTTVVTPNVANLRQNQAGVAKSAKFNIFINGSAVDDIHQSSTMTDYSK